MTTYRVLHCGRIVYETTVAPGQPHGDAWAAAQRAYEEAVRA